ncbi:MAG: hypothetical protein J6O55_00845 [Lachnospiraceae bacterium]|nr:hypothetical protein [Lachnospiraceae bacterium]
MIKKNFFSMYPGAVLYGLFFNISLMIDSIIAGQVLGADGITAVAVGVPGYGAIAAVIYSLIHGSGLRMIWAKGHADNEGCRRAYNGGATLVGIAGFIFALLIYAFAYDIVLICGGDMVEPAVRQGAAVYLRFCSPIVFLTALGILLQEVLNVYGFQRERAALGIVNVAVNLIVSISCVSFFPADMKLAGLGLGTSAGGLAEFLLGLILLRILKVPLGYRPLILRPSEIIDTLRSGFPATVDFFSENVIMGIQNNLILSGFPGDRMILPTAEVVCNISYFASGAIKGAAIAAEPLFGVFYSERDVNSIKKVWKQGWTIGFFASIVWAALFYLALPVLSSLCGMELSYDISRGVLLCLIFAPVMHTVYMFTLYYEGIKRFALSIVFAVIPDSCLYILMMALLIPILGKDGIWLSITGNQLIGLILLIPLVLLLGAGSGRKMDRLLLLPKEFYTEPLLNEFDISGADTDEKTEFEKLKAPLKGILSYTDRIDSVLGCAEDLVSDMRQSSDSVHIKLMGNKERAELFVRSYGNRWELPLNISEKIKSWGKGVSITSSYVYKMNIVCVTLDAGL